MSWEDDELLFSEEFNINEEEMKAAKQAAEKDINKEYAGKKRSTSSSRDRRSTNSTRRT